MPCRICTANDEEALIDAIAEAVWESFASRAPEDHRTWAEAGDQWQRTYRRHARAMVTRNDINGLTTKISLRGILRAELGRIRGTFMKRLTLALLLSSSVLAAPAAATTVTVAIPDVASFVLLGNGTASITIDGVVFSTSAAYSDANFYQIGTAFGGQSTPALSSQQGTFGLSNILITLPTLASAITVNYATFYGVPVTFGLSNGSSTTQGSSATYYEASDVYDSGTVAAFSSLQITASAKDVLSVGSISYDIAAVPEPATWAMMIAGFGLVGGALRRRSTNVSFAI